MPRSIVVDDISEPITHRTLTLGNEPVVVTIGKPHPFDPERLEGYYCPYSIEFSGRKTCRYSGGSDAAQALQLVMTMISADLTSLGRAPGEEIGRADTPDDTGFR
ncbi:MAG: hypothetical protein AAGA21_11955 [Pseudomonadota bacterium]